VNLLVLATSRTVEGAAGPGGVNLERPLFGSYVRIQCEVGTVWLDGDIMTFEDGMEGVFTSAGFAVVHSNKGEPGRRLQGIFELMGLFNSLPIFAGWNSTFDSPPRMPLSFTADAWVMYSCVQRGTDMCKRFNLQTHMFNGESYTRSKVYLQADDGMKYERHEDLVRLPGWRYEKYTLDGVAHQSQTWKQTGDRFHCRSNATDLIVPVGSLDPTKFLASFAGETVVDGETWNKIVLKGREAQMMTVEYWVAMQRSSVSGDFEAHPRVIQFTRGPYDPDPSGPEHGNSLRFAYLFDRFTPQDGESGRFISFDGQDLPGVPFQCQQDAQESDASIQ